MKVLSHLMIGVFLALASCTKKSDVKTSTNDPKVKATGDLSTYSKALFKTDKGNVEFEFLSKKAPNTVKRIKELVHQGFYNGIVFHRVVPKFVAQAGDPTGTGTSGSGVKLKAEFNDVKHERGIISMARAFDKDSADSQFFIVLEKAPHLDGKYTAFGKMTKGLDIIDKISKGDKIQSAVLVK